MLHFRYIVPLCLAVLTLRAGTAFADTPPAINPFGSKPTIRDDAIPGYVELSDKITVHGRIYLTHDFRLKIYDEQKERQRDIPLCVIRKIECKIKKEWVEKEWRFRENANNVKVYTGRTYPAREYLHTITLNDDRKITGPISAIIYVQSEDGEKPKRFLLHKRQKGEFGDDLKSLTYVRLIELGEYAYERSGRYYKEQGKREAESSRKGAKTQKGKKDIGTIDERR